jgi:hypothetical protein
MVVFTKFSYLGYIVPIYKIEATRFCAIFFCTMAEYIFA